MVRIRPAQALAARQGVILLVVITLLTLFAVVGLTFVMYAQAEANSMRAARQAETLTYPDADPEMLLAYYLGQLIYGPPDGVPSTMRNWDLARNMYGMFTLGGPGVQWTPGLPGTVPFNGAGRLQNPPLNGSYWNLNYSAALSSQLDQDGAPNPPYTYPDVNNLFLAAVRSNDGMILIPSFVRNGPNGPVSLRATLPFAPEDGFCDVKNLPDSPGWLHPNGNATPNDSVWMDLGFPVMSGPDGRLFKPLFAALIQDMDGRVNVNTAGNLLGQSANPATTASLSHQGWCAGEVNPGRILAAGDVANLLLGYRYGSTWNKYPVSNPYSPGGHFYSHTDINCNPNPPPGNPPSALVMPQTSSNFAFPWYNSPYATGWLLASENNNHPNLYNYFSCNNPNLYPAQDWYATVAQSTSANPPLTNRRFPPSDMEALLRYGDRGSPALTSNLFTLCPSLNPIVNPAVRRQLTTLSMDLARPGVMPSMILQAGTYTIPNANNAPAPQPPAPQYPTRNQTTFPIAGLPSGEFGPPINLAGSPPQNYSPYYAWASYPKNAARVPVLNRIDLNRGFVDYPPVSAANYTFTNYTNYQGYAGINYGNYTGYGTAGSYQINPTAAPPKGPFPSAMQSRVEMAQEIFAVLCVVTGANVTFQQPVTTSPLPLSLTSYALTINPNPNTPEYDAIRWLAQLAVNIVDFVSYATPNSQTPDDVMTMFNWNPAQKNSIPNGWVFGTVLPRLVINEAYVEIDNDPNDPGIQGKPPAQAKATEYDINCWAELHNPFAQGNGGAACVNQAVATSLGGNAQLYVPSSNYGAYRLLLVQDSANNVNKAMAANNNVLGLPYVAGVTPNQNVMAVVDFTKPKPNAKQQVVTPPGLAMKGPTPTVSPGTTQGNQGYYVIGPNTQFPGKNPFATYQVDEQGPSGTCVTSDATLMATIYSYPKSLNFNFNAKGNSMRFPIQATAKTLTSLPTNAFVLQRLACPYMPPQFNPTSPNFNPYVTVDYVVNVPTNDGVNTDSNGPLNDHQPAQTPVNNRYSVGRNQPYAASQQVNQQNKYQTYQSYTGKTSPQNTFFYPNAQGTAPFAYDWLFWANRMLVSPMELLHVSGYKPSQLTQMFVQGNTPTNAPQSQNKFMHRAPWFDALNPPPSSVIYRALEFFEAGLRPQWAPIGGRVPGRININTIWDYPSPPDAMSPPVFKNTLPPTFMALCDPQGNNYFLNQAVKDMYSNMLNARTPQNVPMPGDQPFLGLAAPYATGAPTPGASGMNGTFLRRDPGVKSPPPQWPVYTTANWNQLDVWPKPLFAANPSQNVLPNGNEMRADPLSNQTVDQAYLRNELMIKMFNNITTRSNVFAVWLTVGFFEIDPTTGQFSPNGEINKAEGRNVRHRMFAIVDRTNLSILLQPGAAGQWTVSPNSPGPRPFFINSLTGAQAGSTTTFTIPASLAANYYEDLTWGFNGNQLVVNGTPVGSALVVDAGPNQEIVTIASTKAVAGQGVQITLAKPFQKPHPPGFAVSNAVLGHPGPQPYFDPRNPQYNGVVRYFSIIQ